MEKAMKDAALSEELFSTDIDAYRPPMNQEEFDIKFAYKTPKENVTKDRLKKTLRRYYAPCDSPKHFLNALFGFIPIIRWLPTYSLKEDFALDVIGGLTVGIMHVPQGIAYASLAQVPAVVGLYTSFFPPLFYMIFGTSRHNSLGTFAVVSLMAGVVANREVGLWNEAHGIADNSTDFSTIHGAPMTTTDVNIALAFTIGIVHIVMGLLRLSFIATYFSDQVVAGFTTAASMHVFVAQLKDIFSIRGLPSRTGAGQLFLKLYDMFSRITYSNPYTILISLVSIAFLLMGKLVIAPYVKKELKSSIPIPFELILVIIVTFISTFCDFEHKLDLRIVGDIPTGLPKPQLPKFSLIPHLIGDAIGIGAVIYAIHISLAKMFAKKMNYKIDTEQELYAIGLTSILSGFFPIYAITCSLGRTLVNVAAGTKTQLSSIFSSCLLLAVILYFGQYLRELPMCVLSAIIIVALRGMLNKFADLKRLYPLSTIDFSVWVVSFVATVSIDVMPGLLISLCYALMSTVFRTQWSRYHTLANLVGTSDYRDTARYHYVTYYSGIAALRFDAPLLFTNVERFKHAIHKTLDEWNHTSQSKADGECMLKTPRHHFDDVVRIRLSSKISPHIIENALSHHFIIDCSGITMVDYMGVNALKEIFAEMRSRKVLVYFAAAKAPVRELFESSGFYKYVPKENFYPTIHDAVLIARQRQKSLQEVDQRSELSLDVVEEMVLTHPLH